MINSAFKLATCFFGVSLRRYFEAEEGDEAAAAAARPAAPLDPIPDVEWWDEHLLLNGTYDDISGGRFDLKPEKISLYVEHPVPLDPPMEPADPPPQPLKLTKKEQKKLRTQR